MTRRGIAPATLVVALAVVGWLVTGVSVADVVKFVAYDIASELLRRLGVFPRTGNSDDERLALELDEFERGYPRLTPALLLDVMQACHDHAEKPPKEGRGRPKSKEAAGDPPPMRVCVS